MTITIPHDALVVLIGAAGSGKSSFAAAHFHPSQIVSSDRCRWMVSDDATDQRATADAFKLFHLIIAARLRRGRLTVADATNLKESSRKELLQLAAKHRRPVVACVVDRSLDVCMAQNAARARNVPEDVIRKHYHQMMDALLTIPHEGFTAIYSLPADEAYTVEVTNPFAADWALVEGLAFDIIGDIHGCADELEELLAKLGYVVRDWGETVNVWHPGGRRLVFLGDLTDRGPKNLAVLRLVRAALESGHHAVRGNHDEKLWKALRGRNVQRGHGLAATMEELEAACSLTEREQFAAMLEALPYHLILASPVIPGSRAVVAHAGLPRDLVQTGGATMRAHALFGETRGTDASGMPVRGTDFYTSWPLFDAPLLIHGHTVSPVVFPAPGANVACLDQGCAFGGRLTALSWPEFVLTHVEAKATYCTD